MINALTPSTPKVVVIPKATDPATAEALYKSTDDLIELLAPAIQQDPSVLETLKTASSDLKASFRDQVVAADALPQLADDGRKAALQALAAGTLAGALDGLIVLGANQAAPTPSPAPAPAPPASGSASGKVTGDDIKKDLQKLLEDLQEELGQAKDSIKNMGKDALQSTSKYEKLAGESLVDHGDFFSNHPKTPVAAYRSYLCAAFSEGYGLGVTDAAIVTVADQTPGAAQP